MFAINMLIYFITYIQNSLGIIVIFTAFIYFKLYAVMRLPFTVKYRIRFVIVVMYYRIIYFVITSLAIWFTVVIANINPRNTDTGGYIASFEFRRQNGRQSRHVPLIIGIVLCIEFSGTQRVVVIVLAENLFVCAVVDITKYEPPAPL